MTTLTIDQYKKLTNPAKGKKTRQRRKQKENILQQQVKNRLDCLAAWNQLNKKVIMQHVPNERIFAGAIQSLLASKGVPLNATQFKLINNYLSGFAKNIKKAGAITGAFDNIFFTENANIFLAEAKIGSNSLTLEQKAQKHLLMDMGFNLYEFRNLDEFDEILRNEKII